MYWLKNKIPILNWLPNYNKKWLRSDLIAALTLLALLVPEGLAYSEIAGLPLEAAFYATPVALIGYVLFSKSRHVITAPSSTIAAMSAAVIGGLAVVGSKEYILLSAALALTAGVLFFVFGFIKLGFISEFFSKSIITGFIFGLALIIAIGQMPKLFGIGKEGESFFQELFHIITNIPHTNLLTLLIGASSLGLLFLLHKKIPRIPGALAVLIFGIALVSIFNLDGQGVHIVGNLPSALPTFSWPSISISQYIALIPGALSIVLVAYAETIGAAKNYANKYKYKVDNNQELMALGSANMAAGLFQGFAVDASLSKSAANESSGGKSQMSSLIAAILFMVTILLFTPFFHNLPEATLAAIVIHAVWGLFNIKELIRIYKINHWDLYLALVALFGVLIFGILPGLIIAVVLSLVAIIYKTSQTEISTIGVSKDCKNYGDIKLHPNYRELDRVKIIRLNSSLYFANNTILINYVDQIIDSKKGLDHMILNLEMTSDLDAPSVDCIGEIYKKLKEHNIRLHILRLHSLEIEKLKDTDLYKSIGKENFYNSIRPVLKKYDLVK